MDYEIRPLTQGFGAEVFGLDLSAGFSDNLAQDLVGAWVDAGGLMVIHNQTLSSEKGLAPIGIRMCHFAIARHKHHCFMPKPSRQWVVMQSLPIRLLPMKP